jgi:hypothetical protein
MPIAEHVAKTIQSILFIENGFTMNTTIEFLENWIKISGYI